MWSSHPSVPQDGSGRMPWEQQGGQHLDVRQLPLPQSALRKPGQSATSCSNCGKHFAWFFTAKNHCQRCGELVCRDCLQQQLPHNAASAAPVLVCFACIGEEADAVGER